MPPPTKRVKAARHNGCGNCASTIRAKELTVQLDEATKRIEEQTQENQRLQEQNRLLAEQNNRFPDLLAVWRTRYEEAMNRNLGRVLMHGGDVFLPMGVHLREMRTVDTWKRRFETEQKRRKTVEGYIERWKKNNNQIRKDLENEQRAHRRSKKLLEMWMPEGTDDSEENTKIVDTADEALDLPMPLTDIKLEEDFGDLEEDTDQPIESLSTPNEFLINLALFDKHQ